MKDLPTFQKRTHSEVLAYISQILINEKSGEQSLLIDLLDYPDGHFRAVFDPAYFVVQPGETEPTKSQWNSLKKKLKRHDPSAFVFKDHGQVDGAAKRYYLDFGFLPDLPPANRRR